MGRWFQVWVGSCLWVGLLGLEGQPARADCALPPARVLWSYPGEGATDVPLNANLILIVEGGSSASATIDGVALERIPELSDAYRLPGNASSPTVDIALVDWTGEPAGTHTLSFQYASGSGAVAEEPRIEVFGMREAPCSQDFDCDLEAGVCTDIAFADTCFDTGPPTRQSFPSQLSGVAWLVEQRRVDDGGVQRWLVPASCREAVVLTWGPDDDNRSYQVFAVAADGSLAAGPELAGPEAEPLDPQPNGADGGTGSDGEGPSAADAPKAKAKACQVSAPGAPAAGYLAIAFAVVLAGLSRRPRTSGPLRGTETTCGIPTP